MAIDELAEERCTGCGICFSTCPQDVFRLDRETGKAVVTYPADCVSCWSCEMFCPVHCIKVSEPRPMKLPAPY
jgi:NAD-dependent dihydropyrimidine dehydrogenase PreA subunit